MLLQRCNPCYILFLCTVRSSSVRWRYLWWYCPGALASLCFFAWPSNEPHVCAVCWKKKKKKKKTNNNVNFEFYMTLVRRKWFRRGLTGVRWPTCKIINELYNGSDRLWSQFHNNTLVIIFLWKSRNLSYISHFSDQVRLLFSIHSKILTLSENILFFIKHFSQNVWKSLKNLCERLWILFENFLFSKPIS